MTKVFIEQPLALSGSAKQTMDSIGYIYKGKKIILNIFNMFTCSLIPSFVLATGIIGLNMNI